jgi:aminoglycoside/choline kinase family phosphotransferase
VIRRSPISHSNTRADERLAALRAWLQSIEAVADAELVPASVDASFRRYFRLQSGVKSFIAMDAPPGQEDCVPFIRIAGYLEARQLHAPRILDVNLDEGFLLLTDLGETQYFERLSTSPGAADELYADAIIALRQMQDRGTAFQSTLPPYDRKLLQFELSLFHDWLCEKHLGIEFSEVDEMNWTSLCECLINSALDQPQVFVHRDYHSRNLMVGDEDNPGILDFQDAVEGPLTYDLVSLLKDCYLRWPAEKVRAWALAFYARLEEGMREQLDAEYFLRYFHLMGVQRHLKAAGIFARLNHRDGKPDYMRDVPRTLQYIVDLEPEFEELDFLIRLIKERCLPALQEQT